MPQIQSTQSSPPGSESVPSRSYQGAPKIAVSPCCGKCDDCDGFHHILVAFDESEQANYALDAASRLARELGAVLSVLHVIQLPFGINTQVPFEVPEVRAGRLARGTELLDHAVARLNDSCATEKVLREGDAATEIVDVAHRLGVDLVVIGTHGRGRLATALIGSVASAVMRQASCPVLAVSHPRKKTRETADVVGLT